MGSQSQPKIPVIDMSNESLKPGISTWLSTCKEIRHAFEEIGCFEAIYREVPLELHNNVFATAAELFGLPNEIKMKNKSTKTYFDYFGQYASLPLYESLAIDNPTSLESTQSFTTLMWPAGYEGFCESAHSYAEIGAELEKMVMRMLCESYGLDDEHYESYTESANYLLRYFKYRTPKANETTVGLNPHTDKTLRSTIHQSHIKGLQIRTKDDEWIDVEPSPTSFLVMAGYVLTAWSNDRIRPCWHKVNMTASETRISMGLFSFISGTVNIPEEFADDTWPLRYKPFNHFRYLRFNSEAEPKGLPSTLKDYCGM
ncbi:probable inactive 2-oxoglutarate-dependent dioxygenase AOP2 [Pistacia vera]|nr:probable inactive 2-oxoglutarate-dependent dioxygenase AOP2 [Pistacia vera]